MSFCLCLPHQFLGTGPAKGLKNKGFLGSVPHRICPPPDPHAGFGQDAEWVTGDWLWRGKSE